MSLSTKWTKRNHRLSFPYIYRYMCIPMYYVDVPGASPDHSRAPAGATMKPVTLFGFAYRAHSVPFPLHVLAPFVHQTHTSGAPSGGAEAPRKESTNRAQQALNEDVFDSFLPMCVDVRIEVEGHAVSAIARRKTPSMKPAVGVVCRRMETCTERAVHARYQAVHI